MAAEKSLEQYEPRELRVLASRKEFWTSVRFFNESLNALMQLEEARGRKRHHLDAIREVQRQLAGLAASAGRYWEDKERAPEEA